MQAKKWLHNVEESVYIRQCFSNPHQVEDFEVPSWHFSWRRGNLVFISKCLSPCLTLIVLHAWLKSVTWLSHPLPYGIFHVMFSKIHDTRTSSDIPSFLLSSGWEVLRIPQGCQGSCQNKVHCPLPISLAKKKGNLSLTHSNFFHSHESLTLGVDSQSDFPFLTWLYEPT